MQRMKGKKGTYCRGGRLKVKMPCKSNTAANRIVGVIMRAFKLRSMSLEIVMDP